MPMIMTRTGTCRFATILLLLSGVFAASAFVMAQAPAPAAALKLTATSDNVSSAGETIKINLSHWSTDAERDQFVAAWTLTGAGRGGAAGRGGGAGGGGGGGGGAGRGGAARGAAPAASADAAAPDLPPLDTDGTALPAAARGGAGGGGGRGGRGGGGGNTPALTPAGSLLTALQNAPVAGFIWTSDVTGYAIHYAYKLPLPNGGQRIILASDRRLGVSNGSWKPAGNAAPTDYEFTLLELRLNPKGEGEGKASLTGKVVVDPASKSIALESYDSLPVVLKGVKPQ